MNLCRETVKMGVPPDNRRDLNPMAYLNSTSKGSRLEDARKDAHIIRARSAQSRKRVPSFTVGAADL